MAGRTGTPKSKTKGEKPARKVLFKFSAPEANQVYLAGDFNNWDTAALPTTRLVLAVSRTNSEARIASESWS